ncbi:MAG TPA: hypothetical protein VGF55_20950 [Gemmataceae bacterium]
MTRPRLAWVVVALLAAAGCRNCRSELVEAELRTRERELRELRGELLRSESMNEALENTLKAQQCNQPVLRPGPSALALVKDVQLGRGTGGIDEDRIPGDEGIQVVLVPRDIDGSPIKAPGTLKVTALGITPEGLKTPLSTWDVSALQLRRSWRSGLISTGYFVALPWQRLPTTERLRIVATFMPLEGGVFEAERDVTIKLLAEATRCQPPLSGPAGLAPLSGPAGLGPPLPGDPQAGTPPTGGLQPPVPIDTIPTGPPPRTGPPPEQIPAPRTPGTPSTSSKPAEPADVAPLRIGGP